MFSGPLHFVLTCTLLASFGQKCSEPVRDQRRRSSPSVAAASRWVALLTSTPRIHRHRFSLPAGLFRRTPAKSGPSLNKAPPCAGDLVSSEAHYLYNIDKKVKNILPRFSVSALSSAARGPRDGCRARSFGPGWRKRGEGKLRAKIVNCNDKA